MLCATGRFLSSVAVVVLLEALVGVFITRQYQEISISIFNPIIGSFVMEIELERVATEKAKEDEIST